MAVSQSQYNFIRFTASGDAMATKGLLAGFILTKTALGTVGAVKISSYNKAMHIVPTTFFGSNANPVTVINFPEFGMPIFGGLYVGICSNMNVIAMKR